MRTTITLDPDVAAVLERLRRRDPRSFRALVNDLLRKGIADLEPKGAKDRPPYRTRGADLGACRVGSLDDVAGALAVAEGERFR
jgi:hypothetical protein